jgi:hypothetical protein
MDDQLGAAVGDDALGSPALAGTFVPHGPEALEVRL